MVMALEGKSPGMLTLDFTCVDDRSLASTLTVPLAVAPLLLALPLESVFPPL
jgi:hypothetical protein